MIYVFLRPEMIWAGVRIEHLKNHTAHHFKVDEFNEVTVEEFGYVQAFKDIYAPRKALVVCNEKNERIVEDIRIIPWRKFLFDLWFDQ